MPLYEYSCSACAHRFERIVKFSDAPLKICPQCGRETIEQLISAPAVQFKGSGWYVTDYARKASPSATGSTKGGAGQESGAASKDGSSSDAASSASSDTGSSDKSAAGAAPSAGANSSSANNASGSSSSGGEKNSQATKSSDNK
jgi:putative FmdB family regulatory protein